MGTSAKPLEIVWTVNVVKQHQVAVKAETNAELSGTLAVSVDGQQILSMRVNGEEMQPTVHQFSLDDRELELRWFWGDPHGFVLTDGQIKLASHGDPDIVADLTKPVSPGSATRDTKAAGLGFALLVGLALVAAAASGVWWFFRRLF